jgi:hypothetical protein
VTGCLQRRRRVVTGMRMALEHEDVKTLGHASDGVPGWAGSAGPVGREVRDLRHRLDQLNRAPSIVASWQK